MKHYRFLLLSIITGLSALLPERALAQPLILAVPNTKSAFVGDGNVSLQVLATGTTTLSYQWQTKISGSFSNISNNTTFAGVTTPTLTINFTDTTLNGTKYRCVVTDTAGSTNSLGAQLNIFGTPSKTPTVTVTGTGVDGNSNPTIAANSTANITIQVSGLNPGDTVRIQRTLDLNGNGKTDPGEPLAQSFVVTDGQQTTIGGIIDPDIPGDDDGVADGTITTHITLPSSPEVGRNAGTFLIKVASPTGEFKTITKTLVVTQPNYGQTVSGQVTSGGTPVPFAPVIFLMSTGGNNQSYVAGIVANATGNYTLQVPIGANYTVISTAPGYVQPFSTANQTTVSSGLNQTGINVSITPATCTITAPGNDTSGNPLHGAQYFIQSNSMGEVAIAFTDSDSNFIAALTSASDWKLELSQNSAHLLGYLQPQNPPVIDTTGGSVLESGPIELTAGNALIYGVVKDNENNLLAGVNVNANDANNQDNATTYGNGSYYLLANGPASGTPDPWNVNLSNNNPTLTNYLSTQNLFAGVFSSQAYANNFVLQPTAASLQGTVKENGTPVSGIQIDLFYNGQFEDAVTTDGSGNFSFGVATGNWSLALDTFNDGSFNVVGPILAENVTGNQSITGIAFPVLATTGTISGNVQNGNSSGSVSATTTVSGVIYNSEANLNSSGDYSLPVFNGLWNLVVTGNNGQTYNSQNVTVSGSATANFSVSNTPPPLGSPLILAGVTNKSAFVGDANVTLQVLATSSTSLTYQWQSKSGSNSFANITNSGTYAGATTANLTINSPVLSLNGTIFRCLVTNSTGTVKSSNGTLNVFTTPLVTPILTITPDAFAANNTGRIDLQVANLTSGDTVKVQIFQDSNGNGKGDIGEPLVESFTVTDGQNILIGGVADPDMPGDDDQAVDGNITTHIQAGPGGFTAGTYVAKIVSPTGEFKPVTQPFTITQPIYGQTFGGQVTSGGVPVPYAEIVLLSQFEGHFNFAGGMITDVNGNYTMQAPPGSYTVFASALGFVQSESAAPSITVQAGVNQTGVNVDLIAATCTITTKVEDESGNPTLAGVHFNLQSNHNGQVGFSYTDTNGNLIGAVTAASDWDIQVSSGSEVHALGYLQPQNDSTTDTSAGSTTPAPILLTRANTLITGKVQDTSGNSLSGVSVEANDTDFTDTAITDDNGNYFLLANGPNSGSPDSWSVSVDTNNPALANYTLPDSQNVDVLSGQNNNSVNFTVEAPPIPLGFPLVLAGATSQTAFVGDASAKFTVLAASNTTLTYQWQTNAGGGVSNITNNGTFAGATTATLMINSPTLALNGIGYRCIVTNSNGSVNSIGAQLKVYGAPSITPNFSVSPGTIAANSTNNVDFHVTGLSSGDTVQVQIFADANGNSQTDIGEPLVDSYSVTDGQGPQIGGITDPDLPGDDDGNMDGNITTHVNLASSAVGGQLAGTYIVKVSSPTGEFKPLTQTVTVTQPNYGQTISGQISSGGTPVPYAAVLLLTNSGHDKLFVAGVHADATGHYSLAAPTGSYVMFAVATGYVMTNSSAPNITVLSTQNQSGVNLSLDPATCTITANIGDPNGNSLGGVEVSTKSNNSNQFSFAYSDPDGNLIAAVTAANDWTLSLSGEGLHALGYLQPQNDTPANTSGGSVILSSISLTQANALIYGTVKDNLGNPLAGVNLDSDDSFGQNADFATTDSSGNYYLLANGPECGDGQNWNVSPDNNNPALANFVTPTGQNVDVNSGQSYLTNFTVVPATARLQGTVTNAGTPVSGIELDLFSVGVGSPQFVTSITTGNDGTFNFGVTNGNWSLALDSFSNNNDSFNVVGPNLSENVTGNHTISGIAYQVITATGTISGTVGNGASGGNAFGSAIISGVLYNTSAQIGSNGGYSLPVINGSWTIGVNANNGQNYSNQTISVTGSAVANFTQSGGGPTPTFLNGTVTQNGNPVANVTLDASDENGNHVTMVTGTDGTFSLQVTAGNWTLTPSSNDPNVILPQPGGGSVSNEPGPEDPALFLTVTAGVNINNIAIVALTPTSHITGTVLDQHNNPLSAHFSMTATTVINNVPYQVNGSTDNTGHYSLGVLDGTWFAFISSSGYLIPNAQVLVVNGSDLTANFTINVTAYLQGTVTDNHSQPVAGLSIGAIDENGNTLQTTTANDGTFSLGVIGGNWAITFPNGSGPNIILPSSQISYTVTDGTNITSIAVPVLAANEQITGRVFDSNNQPIATTSTSVSANISINGVDFSTNTFTDDTGNYTLNVTNGTWTVDAFPQGYLTPVPQNATVSGSAQVANFNSPATAHLLGTVTQNAIPVVGANITAMDDNSDEVFTTTGADGTFDLGVIGGAWTVFATSDDPTLILPESSVIYNVTDGTNITNIIIPALHVSAQISGTVVDANDQPNADVSITASITLNQIDYAVFGQTDQNGEYSIGVANGTWVVNAHDFTFGHDLTPQNVTITGSNQTANFNSITAHLRGTVTENGNGLSGVIINAYDENNDQFQTTSASDGTFDLPVFGGFWTVNIVNNDPTVIFPLATNTFSVTDGVDVNDIAIPLLKGSEQIFGTVLFSNNEPITDAEVVANTTINSVNYSVITYTDLSGHYSLALTDGTWQVSIITKTGLNLNPQNIVVNGASEAANFTEPVANFAQSATAYLIGTVIEGGVPVSGVTIHGYDANGDYDFTNSAADGTFSLGVIGGDWTLYFSSSDENLILPNSFGPYNVTNGTNITNIAVPALAVTEQISGTVLDLNGQASVGATVTATTTINSINYSVNTFTDGSGHYSLGVANGTWQINVGDSGFNPPSRQVVVSGSNQTANFTETATAALIGSVTLNGNPVSDVVIHGGDFNNDFDNTTSAVDGTFSLGVISGDWTLTFSSSNPNLILPIAFGPYTVTNTGVSNIMVPVLAATEQISGTVFGFNGQASVGAQITATTTINDVSYAVNTFTDGTGHYALGVANGTWHLTVSGAGFNPAPQDVVINNANAVANFTENATAFLDGTVTENGVPVSGVTVHGYDNNNDFDFTATCDGTFNLGVVGGDWTLYFSSDDNTLILPSAFGPYAVTDGTNITNILVPGLLADEQISGTVHDLNGQPSIGAEVIANTTINGIAYTVNTFTDANGQYELGVADGTWQINVTGAGFNPSPQTVVVNGADAVVIFTAVPPYSNANLTVVMLNDANLVHPGQLATDGTTLYVSGGAADNSSEIFSVPTTGGAATLLHPAFEPQQLAFIGGNVDWIDPNSGPVTDTQILSAATTSGGSVTAIYTGENVGEPIVDGSGLASDGVSLYAADEVDGTVWRLNPDGSSLTELGSPRYSGGFSTEHFNSVAVDQGVVYVADSGDASASIAPEIDSIAANGDGSSSFTKIFCGAPLVRPVSIAAGGGFIYVADADANNTIWQIPESGGTPVALLPGAPFISVTGLAYFNGFLYITDSGAGVIYKLTLPTTPPSITLQPNNNAIVTGSNATFTVTAGGAPSPTIQWQVSNNGGSSWSNLTDGTGISGSASPTLTLATPSTDLSGFQYRAVASSSGGSPSTSTPVSLQVGISSSYLTWLNSNFTSTQLGNPAVSGISSTPAHDGIPNLLKYALGLPPLQNDQHLMPHAIISSGMLAVSFSAAQTDIHYQIQTSTDAIHWGTTGFNVSMNGNVETATSEIPPHLTIFLRIVVTPNQSN